MSVNKGLHRRHGLLGDRLERPALRIVHRADRAVGVEQHDLVHAHAEDLRGDAVGGVAQQNTPPSAQLAGSSLDARDAPSRLGVGGMVPIMRVQANGEMQFERTLKAAMSSAIERDRPTMPILAAE